MPRTVLLAIFFPPRPFFSPREIPWNHHTGRKFISLYFTEIWLWHVKCETLFRGEGGGGGGDLEPAARWVINDFPNFRIRRKCPEFSRLLDSPPLSADRWSIVPGWPREKSRENNFTPGTDKSANFPPPETPTHPAPPPPPFFPPTSEKHLMDFRLFSRPPARPSAAQTRPPPSNAGKVLHFQFLWEINPGFAGGQKKRKRKSGKRSQNLVQIVRPLITKRFQDHVIFLKGSFQFHYVQDKKNFSHYITLTQSTFN